MPAGGKNLHMLASYTGLIDQKLSCGHTELDAQALCLLAEKTCICWLHTQALGVDQKLSWFDTRLMHWVYLKKYSKIKGSY
jgi:hypothetical protein